MAKQIDVDVNLRDEEAKKKLKDLENGKYNVNLNVNEKGTDKTTQKVRQLSNEAKNTNSVFEKLKNTIGSTFSGRNLAFTAYLAALNEIRKAANNAKAEIKDLDQSVTDLSVAMGQNRSIASNYLKQLNQQAQAIGATTKEVANSADSWLRQGKSAKEAGKLVYDSMMLSKLGQIQSADASKYLTSALNGYKKSASEAIDVVDKLTAVDMQSASDAGGLAESMSKTASAADMAGVSMDKLIGMIASVKEVTQDSDESVGNMFKSVFSRMNQIKAGKFVDSDTGESLNDTEKVLNKVGIAMRDTNNQFISSEKIMDEVGAKWSSFDSTTQRAVATAMAGTYQYNKLIALFNNYSKALDYTKTSAESAGTAIEKFNSSYKESLEAKTNSLQASFESMIMNSDMSKVYSDIVDATNALVQFIDKTGALKNALSGLVAVGAIKAFTSIKTATNEAYINLNKFKNALDIVGKTRVSANNFNKLLLLTNGLSKSQLKLVVSSKALTQAQRTQLLMASGLTEEEAKLQLQNWNLVKSNTGLTASTTSAKNAFSGLWTMIKANPLAIIGTIVSAGVGIWQKYKQSIEEVDQSATEVSQSFDTAKKEIEEYKSKVEELQKTINDSSSLYEDVTDARKQLISIQNELIDKYGSEQTSIQSITDALAGETDAWDKLTQRQWEASKVEFNSKGGLLKDIGNNLNGYKDNLDRMKDEYGNYTETISMGLINGNDDRAKAEELLKRFGTLTRTDGGIGEITLSGNANEVYDKLLQIKEIMSDMDADFGSSFSNELNDMASDAKEVSDTYKDMYDQYVLNEKILSNTDYADEFKKLTDEYQEYQDALSSNSQDEINSETQTFVNMITDAMSTALANGDNAVADYFKAMYPELQAEVDTWNFKIKITPTIDGKDNTNYDKSLDEELKDVLSHFNNSDEILNFNPKASTDKEKKDAYDQLSTIATQDFEGNMEALVDAAIQLYNLQTQGQQDFINRIKGDKDSSLTAGAGSLLSDSGNKININDKTASDWYKSLSPDDQNIANSEKFVQILQDEAEKMNGAELSAENYADALDRVKESKDSISDSTDNSFDTYFNSDDFSDSKSKLLELAKAGQLTPETLSSTQEYLNLLKETGTTAEQACEKIKKLATDGMDFTDWQTQLENARSTISDLQTILTNMNDNKGKLTDDDVDKIISSYPSLIAYMGNEEAMREKINELIGDQGDIAQQAASQMLEYNESAYKELLSSTDDLLKGINISVNGETNNLTKFLSKAYNTDLNNFSSLAEAKLKIESDLIGNLSEGWASFYGVQIDALTGMVSITQNQDQFYANTPQAQEAQSNLAAYNEAITRLNAARDKMASASLGTLGTVTTKSSKSKSKTKSDTAEVFDFIATKLNIVADKASKAKDKIDDLLSFNSKKNQTKKAIEATTDAIKAQEKAYKRYIAYANKAAKTQNNKKTSSSSTTTTTTSTGGQALYDEATKYLGLKYVWGGNSLTTGADCSGFTQQIYKKFGIDLPHYSGFQAQMGSKVTSKKDLQAGDLVFFGKNGKVTHVGIYGGDGKFIEEPHSGASARVSNLSSRKDYMYGTHFNVSGSTTTTTSSGSNVKSVKGVSSKTLEHYKSLIRNGTLDADGIQTIKNENLKNALKDYQTWYEKAKACKEQIVSLKEQLKELYDTLANNPIDKADKQIEKLGTKMDLLNSKMDNLTFNPNKSINTSSITKLRNQITKNYDSQLSASKEEYTTTKNNFSSSKKTLTKKFNKSSAKKLGLTSSELNTIKKNLKDNKKIPSGLINKIYNKFGYCDLYERCIAHNEYLDAYKTAIEDYRQAKEDHTSNVRQAKKDAFDKVQTVYDNKSNLIEQKNTAISNALSTAESRGQLIGQAYYTSQMTNTKSDLSNRKNEADALAKKLKTVDFGSDEWYEAQDALNGIYEAIQQDEQELAEFQKSINELKFDRFDELLNKLGDITDETDFLIDMLDSDNLFDSDTGMITQDGITAIGLTAQNYDTYLAEAQKYKDAIADLNEMYNEGKIGLTDYNSKLREYQQGQRDSIKSANEAKKSLVAYVKQGLDAQNDALSDAIDKKTKLIDKMKEERSFNQSIADLDKTIARLERQEDILKNDDSETNRKKLREIRSKIEDAREDRDNKFYDKSAEDQKNSLSEMLTNSKKQAEDYLKDTDKVFSDALTYVNANSSQVASNIEKIAKDTGYDISSYIVNAWKDSGNAVGDYASTLSSNVPGITAQLSLIASSWQSICDAADRAAEASAKYAETQVGNTQKNNSGSGNTTTSNSGSNDKKATTNTYINPYEIGISNWIKSKLNPAKHDKSYYGALNQYLYKKSGGKVLSIAEEVELANKLKVSVKKDLSGKDDRKRILNALKTLVPHLSFNQGGIITDLVKLSGEDGIGFLKRGEAVLSKEQTQALLNFKPIIPQIDSIIGNLKNIPVEKVSSQSPTYQIDNRTIVEGVATDQIVKQMEGVAQKQAENVVRKINQATYYTNGTRYR
nr:MAG TPA: minor tail protein [Bacteriophage sp.]